MGEFNTIAAIVKEQGKNMLEVIERSPALRRLIYSGYVIGYLYGAAALVRAIQGAS